MPTKAFSQNTGAQRIKSTLDSISEFESIEFTLSIRKKAKLSYDVKSCDTIMRVFKGAYFQDESGVRVLIKSGREVLIMMPDSAVYWNSCNGEDVVLNHVLKRKVSRYFKEYELYPFHYHKDWIESQLNESNNDPSQNKNGITELRISEKVKNHPMGLFRALSVSIDSASGLPVKIQRNTRYQDFHEAFYFDYEFFDLTYNQLRSGEMDSMLTELEQQIDSKTATKRPSSNSELDSLDRLNPKRLPLDELFQDPVILNKFLNEHLPSTEDDTVRLSELTERFVFIDLWYISCAPCLKAIPEMTELKSQLDTNSDWCFVSLNMYDDLTKLEAFKRNWGLTYSFYRGAEHFIPLKYSINSAPRFMVIDKQRNQVLFYQEGYDMQEDGLILSAIQALMEDAK